MNYMRLCGLCAFLFVGSAGLLADTIALSLQPSSQSVLVGATVNVAIDISGLGNGTGTAPSLGAYDLEIAYDPTILGIPTVAFGDPVLGDQLALTFPSLACSGLNPACSESSMPLEITEVSFDLPITLDNNQADAFTMATLGLTAIGTGTSPLTFSIVQLSDSIGNALSPQITNSQVVVSGVAIAPVPEPGSLVLLGFGVLGMVAFRRFIANRID